MRDLGAQVGFKGTIMLENISFERFDADEITSEVTSNGILVTGRKK